MLRLPLAGVVAALLLALAAGCAKRPPTDEEKRAQAEETVRRFFAALPGKDCDVLRPMVVTRPMDDDCPAMMDSLLKHGVRLVEVLGSEVDGRNPEAVMVRVRMDRDGQRREVSLRAEHHPEGWKLDF